MRVVLSVGASWAGKRGAGVGVGRRGLSRLAARGEARPPWAGLGKKRKGEVMGRTGLGFGFCLF